VPVLIMVIGSSTIWIKMMGVGLPLSLLAVDLLLVLLFQLFLLLWIFVTHGHLLLSQNNRENCEGLEGILINTRNK